MTRLSIFAKGNLDVRDSLHSQWVDGQCRWNGINALLRERGSEVSVRVRHEVLTRSDMVLRAVGEVPAVLSARQLPLGTHTLGVQFSASLYAPHDAYVLSIQSDVQTALARHRREDVLFHPWIPNDWAAEDRAWLRDEFEPAGFLDADAAMDNFERIVMRIRAISDAPILIYNVSSTVPGENVHNFAECDELLSTRIRRFNLALIDLSRRCGVSVVDVDRVLATLGAASGKLDTTHFTPQGCRAVAEEVLCILQDYGCLADGATGA